MDKVLTIHEVRKDLEKAQEFAEKINKSYIDGKNLESYDVRSVYELLRNVNASRWTNETF